MKTLLQSIITLLEGINHLVGKVVRWLVLCMVLIQFAIVILRYSFSYSSIALTDSVLYLHAFLFMLGAGYTLLVDAHVRVDIFYAKVSRRAQERIDLIGHLFLLIPSMSALLYWSWPSVRKAWAIREGAISVGGIPGVFVLKTTISAFCVLILIQSLACMLKIVLLWIASDNDRQAPTQPRASS